MMCRHTGKSISLNEHIRRSIEDVLTTAKGSRVMRPTYGSGMMDVIDKSEQSLELKRVVAETIDAWEPRLRLKKCVVERTAPGHLTTHIMATPTITPEQDVSFHVAL